MTRRKIAVALESGEKRVFAVALDWPGWGRSGRSEEEALEALAAYADRYGRAVNEAKLADADFHVAERLSGGPTTDFGAPGAAADADARTLDHAELDRQVGLLRGAWRAFDEMAASAAGKVLATGPRGGGRDVGKMTAHVLEAEEAYLSKLGSRRPRPLPDHAAERLERVRETAIIALRARAAGQDPEVPSRVRERWQPRYWVRRSAWHALDHAWEIEDRLE